VAQASRALPVPEKRASKYEISNHPWVSRVAHHTGLDLTRIADAMPGEYPSVRTHGDMSPWNLLLTPDNRAIAIDWEASEKDGLSGTDLVHYCVVADRIMRNSSLDETLERTVRVICS